MEIKEDRNEKRKAIYSGLATVRESATVTSILTDSKADRGVGKIYKRKKGRI